MSGPACSSRVLQCALHFRRTVMEETQNHGGHRIVLVRSAHRMLLALECGIDLAHRVSLCTLVGSVRTRWIGESVQQAVGDCSKQKPLLASSW